MHRFAIVISVFGLITAAACAAPTVTDETADRDDTTTSYSLNPLTVDDIVGSIGEAGLAVPNPRNVTQRDCPKIGCTTKVETDTVSILKFPSPGSAQLYAASTPSHFQIADVVMIFSPGVPSSEQLAYAAAVKRTVE